ncbi:TPM domain-containing protein [Rhodococcus maanshanensis]|uniref:TPM domain-containing protein n=1 Tax=Rhodococcus maanshanensis TaxID=183556 RepID=UPI0022B324B0|nr:TPM domain-containing protein [Rhodococcus maanshanensis]MCZ4556804.1 TPM domain-containing protein [Rhodococcus maanshanensis]
MALAQSHARGRHVSHRISIAAATASVLALLGLICLPGAAAAETPFRMPGQISDRVGALDDAERADVRAALDLLFDEQHVQLWVTYVASFDGMDAGQWASKTAQQSGLGDNSALLAVATEDRAYALDLPPNLSNVSSAEIDSIEQDAIVPALRQDDWAGAAIAAAGGIDDAMSSSGSGSTAKYLLIGGGIVVIGAGGVVLYARRKKGERIRQGIEAAKDVDWTNPTAIAALPIETLDARAKEVLVETDNAIRTSEEELNLARGEFGDQATAPFIAAYDTAKTTLASAFTLRQRLDDDIPETPDQKRDMLIQLISTCSRADKELNSRVTEFDGMRDLLLDAPARLDALTQDVVELTVRVPQSETTLAGLQNEFPAPALASVSGNVAMAQQQLTFADQNITAGREAAALPAGKQGPAVVAIRAAEGAIAQVRELLDGVDHAADNIRTAIATLPAVLDDARKDIAAAAALAQHGGQPLASAKASTESALAQAEALKDSDPLGAFTAIVKADNELDTVLATAMDAKEQTERAAQRLAQDLTVAQSQITAAKDYLNTRRGAVGAEARTRLSEAERHFDAARQLSQSDPAKALQHAKAAGDLGARALRLAQGDVQTWEASRQPRNSGSNTGAILGGILIESMMRGGMSGGWGNRGGGGGGGGRGPGSFGGPSSSGRISRSGRF